MCLRLALLSFMALLAVHGCGDSQAPPAASTSQTPATPAKSSETLETTPSASSVTAASAPLTAQTADTPEKVSRLAVQSLIDAQPEIFWSLLPPSYQQRINTVARKAAHRFADDELLATYASLARQFADLLREKQDFLLATPVLPFHADPVAAQSGWDDNISRLNELASSELFLSIPLKTFDGERFCSGPGKDLLGIYQWVVSMPPHDLVGKLQQDLDSANFEVVSQTDEETILKMSVRNEPAQEYKFLKVEGRWLPAPFVASFDTMMQQAEAAVVDYPAEQFEEQKAFLIGQASGIEQFLIELRAIQTQEAFDEQLNHMAMQLLPTMLNLKPAVEEDSQPTTDPL